MGRSYFILAKAPNPGFSSREIKKWHCQSTRSSSKHNGLLKFTEGNIQTVG
jgi:hypothetical protein